MNNSLPLQLGFYSGISGLQLPIPKYLFPPAFENASRLTYYASLFNSIEINSSFYKIPQPATIAKWTISVPEHFKFTFKLWKGITHLKNLNFRDEDVAQFLNSINSVQDKRGCLLIQFPPSLGKEFIGQLDKLLSCIREKEGFDWKIAIEFRHKSWYNNSTYKLLNFFESALVIHDIPKSATPMILHESDFMYIRFHGPTGNYSESYSDDFLGEYASYVQKWLLEGKEVYVYFNNTMGDALNNLKTINGFLHH
ncbi:MAG TPA: DUF72 domain-containing protein [Saprospiraceae bacterium]|nr:DUF72 domain-containing protein [Saprospiraceae bacterium]